MASTPSAPPTQHLSETKKPLLPSDSINTTPDVMEVAEVPIIDYSMLRSHDPAQKSDVVEKLGRACLEYGCFIVINHGVPDKLMKSVINGLLQFFDLEENEKSKYNTNNRDDTIRYGRDLREFFKAVTHPHFHSPANPPQLSNDLGEYTKRMREVGLELLRGISKALGEEENFIEKSTKMATGYDIFAANHYPPLPLNSKEKPIAQLPHNDPGLINLLVQDINGGLQIPHKGNWVDVNFQPDCILAAVADHLEDLNGLVGLVHLPASILTNGKYKSLHHRVTVNNKERRVTLPLFLGPSLDATVSPSPCFVCENNPPAYRSMTYVDYLEANKYHAIDAKSCLKEIMMSSKK